MYSETVSLSAFNTLALFVDVLLFSFQGSFGEKLNFISLSCYCCFSGNSYIIPSCELHVNNFFEFLFRHLPVSEVRHQLS